MTKTIEIETISNVVAERDRLKLINAKLVEAMWDLVGDQTGPPLHRWADAVKRGKAAIAAAAEEANA